MGSIRLPSLIFFLSCTSLLWAVTCGQPVNAQIQPSSPPFSLTLEQALAWTPDSELADASNISQVPLAKRLGREWHPLHSGVDTKAHVLLAPDGMNNFGNYITPQPTFNLYNFTNWAYIDILNWFAGTADQTVNLPSRPWVEAAHKNGVKVIGTVFLGVAQWGGSADTVERFLVQDESGRFLMAHQLVALADYYQFDGWLMNQETDLQVVKDDNGNIVEGQRDERRASHLAQRMQAFMTYLTDIAPDHIEIHWYDAMLMDGSVRWQNELNQKNKAFFQPDKNSQPAADAMFVNYWWNAQMVEESRQLALQLGRSPYDVYYGADLWPDRRAQRAFSTFAWLNDLFPKDKPAQTSLALFANNVNFNFAGNDAVAAYSLFADDPADERRFYQAEQRLFAGDDLNIAQYDHHAWPGLGAKIAARSVINALPFATFFNTGHGKSRTEYGKQISASPWHNMAEQDILPTWQFAVVGNQEAQAAIALHYDFDTVFHGGSSVAVNVEPFSGPAALIPLYKTKLAPSGNSKLTLYVNRQASTLNGVHLELMLSNNKTIRYHLATQEVLKKSKDDNGWQTYTFPIRLNEMEVITRISLHVEQQAEAIQFNLGGLRIE